MAGCRPLSLSGFSSSVLLFLWLCHPGLVSLKIIHKKVGDSVEISSGLPTEGVQFPSWKYKDQIVADKSVSSPSKFFGNRLNFNVTTLSLTLTKLTLQDSGNFIFTSEQNGKQRETVTITLLVHESITEDPILTSTHVSTDSNQTCTVLVNCSLKSTSGVSYKMSDGNQTYEASNSVSERTTSKTVTCQDNSTEAVSDPKQNLLVVIGAACAGGLLIITLVIVVVCCCRKKKEGTDSTELTVYADVTDLNINSSHPSCSLYDTIQDASPTPQWQAPTVYDKVNFNRHMK
ncbi:hypothetical protein OJAV_G00234650 [Oryzias javanicus]|uniref:Immunoglobulin subtype domain-containing protein n=1 Tax=Oryzias javanicus TaxID=123683 RepID=A0A3S2MBN4_ORYJA|nr:hypothetical protein OJAV_G00234650 [Oryzias javanicus]